MGITIAEVKSSRLSDNRKEVVVDGKGRYIGDFELCVAVECLEEMIEALVRARRELDGIAAAPAGALAEAADAPPPPAINGAAAPNPNQLRCEVPKNCTVADARGAVLFILNRGLENQKGYALPPDAAKALGSRLLTSADAVIAKAAAEAPPPAN